MLKKYLGLRLTFTARRERVSAAKGSVRDMKVCIKDIMLDGEIIKDHSWVAWDKRTSTIPKGKRFEFKATVAQYLSLDANHKQVIKYKLVKVREVSLLR